MTLEEDCSGTWTDKTTEKECVVSGYCEITVEGETTIADVTSAEECAALGSCAVEGSIGTVAEAAAACADQFECESLGFCAHSLGSCAATGAITLQDGCDGEWSPLELDREECEALGRVALSDVPDFSRAASDLPRVVDGEDERAVEAAEVVVQDQLLGSEAHWHSGVWTAAEAGWHSATWVVASWIPPRHLLSDPRDW